MQNLRTQIYDLINKHFISDYVFYSGETTDAIMDLIKAEEDQTVKDLKKVLNYRTVNSKDFIDSAISEIDKKYKKHPDTQRTPREKIFQLIEAERNRQDRKWGIQNHDNVTWLSILAEEFGETAKEVVDLRNPESLINGTEGYMNLKMELIQTASTAIAFLESLIRNKLA